MNKILENILLGICVILVAIDYVIVFFMFIKDKLWAKFS